MSSQAISFFKPVQVCLVMAIALALPGCGESSTTEPRPPAFSPVESHFEAQGSLDGWSANGDAALPAWSATGGNPGGFISADDLVQGQRWYWVAPSKFLGDVSGAYGQRLRFDLVQGNLDRQINADSADVILGSQNLTVAHRLGGNPGTDWTSYDIPLDESGSWYNKTTGASVGRAELQQVLGSLDRLWIRGEFRREQDFGGLDNVVLGASR